MRRVMSAAALLLFAALQAAMAAEPKLTVTRGAQSTSYTLSDLLEEKTRNGILSTLSGYVIGGNPCESETFFR